MSIEVGETPMRRVKLPARDKVCARCGEEMIEEIPAPRKGQLKHDLKQKKFHKVKVFCPRGCQAGWKPRRL